MKTEQLESAINDALIAILNPQRVKTETKTKTEGDNDEIF